MGPRPGVGVGRAQGGGSREVSPRQVANCSACSTPQVTFQLGDGQAAPGGDGPKALPPRDSQEGAPSNAAPSWAGRGGEAEAEPGLPPEGTLDPKRQESGHSGLGFLRAQDLPRPSPGCGGGRWEDRPGHGLGSFLPPCLGTKGHKEGGSSCPAGPVWPAPGPLSRAEQLPGRAWARPHCQGGEHVARDTGPHRELARPPASSPGHCWAAPAPGSRGMGGGHSC